MNKTGVCVWFDAKKGIGFIKPDDGGKDYFVHYSQIQAEGFKQLEADQKVSFDVGQNHKGDMAVNVKLLA